MLSFGTVLQHHGMLHLQITSVMELRNQLHIFQQFPVKNNFIQSYIGRGSRFWPGFFFSLFSCYCTVAYHEHIFWRASHFAISACYQRGGLWMSISQWASHNPLHMLICSTKSGMIQTVSRPLTLHTLLFCFFGQFLDHPFTQVPYSTAHMKLNHSREFFASANRASSENENARSIANETSRSLH